MAMKSQDLKETIAQLNNGLITEVEFVLNVIANNYNEGAKLVQFNQLDAAKQDWNFTLDAFHAWK